MPASYLMPILMLCLSNVFMTFAWYGHLKNLATAPWYIAAVVSWGIALFEYVLQVPANRIGFQQAGFSVGQLKIMQEVITLACCEGIKSVGYEYSPSDLFPKT